MQKTLAENSVAKETPSKKRNVVKNVWQVIKKITIRTVKFFLISVIGFAVLAIFALYFSFTQTILTQQIFKYVTQKSGFEMEITSLDIDWFNATATLIEPSIRDVHKKQMIFAQKIKIDFNYRNIFQNGNITLEKAVVDRANINLIIDGQTRQLNIVQFSDTLAHVLSTLLPASSSSSGGASPKFIIKKIVLKDNYFGYEDNRVEPFIDHRLFDYNHFGLDRINLKASHFMQASDTTQVQIDALNAHELGSNWPVHHVSTFFRVFNKEMQFWKLNCQVGKSVLRDEVIFKYFRMGLLSSFNERVGIVAHLDQSVVHSEDLARFDYYFKDMQDKITASGKVVGRVVRFKATDMKVSFGQKSFIKGDFLFDGLPEVDSTQMNLYFEDSNLLASDLSPYAQSPSTDSILQKFGNIKYRGAFEGSISDFQARGKVKTDLGTIITDAQFQLHENEARSTYQGKVETQQLHLGKLIDRPEWLQYIDLKGTIKGQGFSTQNARFDLKANIDQIGVLGYNYQNIRIDGELGQNRFNGQLDSRDPHLNLNLKGVVDFAYRDSTNQRLSQGKFNLISNIRHIDFRAIGLSQKPASLQGDLVMNVKGLDLDSLVGNVTMDRLELMYNNRNIAPEKAISFQSSEKVTPKGQVQRSVKIDSDYLQAKLVGDFRFSQLIQDLPAIRQEYKLSFLNDSVKIKAYYDAKKNKVKHAYSLNYEFTLGNLNPVLNLLDIDASISSNVNFEGYLVQDDSLMIASLHTTDNIPQISYQDYQFFDTRVDLLSQGQIDSSNVYVEFYVSSNKQNFAGIAGDSLLITTRWQRDSIDFSLNLAQVPQTIQGEQIHNKIKLAGGAKIAPHEIAFTFQDSYFNILNKTWRIEEDNLITWQDSSITVKDIFIRRTRRRKGAAYIGLAGRVSYDPHDTLQLSLNNIRITPFAKLAGMNASGLLRSSFKIHQGYTNLQVDGEAYVYNLMIDSVLIGDIMANKLAWEDSTQQAAIDLDLYRRSMHPMLGLYGTYSPFAKTNDRFDISAKLQGMKMLILEPFFRPYLSQLNGSANGRLRLLGSVKKPVLAGNVNVVNGTFKINYLGSKFYFADEILFRKNEIAVNNLRLYDNWNHYQEESKTSFLRVKGGIYHDYFSNFLMALEGNFRNLQVIDKIPMPNESFYGKAYASGNLKVTGYIDNLVEFKVNASSEKGTRLYMPLDGYTDVSQKSYIEFVNLRDSLKKQTDVVKKVSLNGLKMDFNLDLNENAQFEIIFDKQAGDLIRGTGNGKINLEMDEEGDFSIFGDYVISKGTYNFTLLNLINKGFDIDAGSKVSFIGDVYDSDINIRAKYLRQVSLLPLLNLDQLENPQNPEYRRRYPVNVLLNLQGKLLNPEIKLDLDLGDANRIPNPILSNAFRSVAATIQTDEQERNRQVFSVLVLQRFSPRNSFGGLGAATGSSLSELLSNQLSNWVSQVDKNLELTLDLDPSALDAAQLNVSYSLFDGRLRISREGGFTNTQNQTDVASVVGEWTLEYMLSPDGRFRAKMYNKNNQGVLGNLSLTNATTTTAGFSLLYTKSFSSLSDLIQFGKRKKKSTKTNKPNKANKKEKKKSVKSQKTVDPKPIKKPSPRLERAS